jgi:Ser/Thr protein kinase RdoA (MazF antagonist)
MPSQVQGWPWPHERAVRAAVDEHWGRRDELRPMEAKASRIWQSGGHIVKLARDEPAHFSAGLLASERVERAGLATGAPVRTRAGELCVPLVLGRESWVLAVVRRVDGSRLSMHEIAPAVMGEFLITAAHPPSSRRMINQAVSDVSAYYGTAPPVQLLYGDGPGIFSANGTDISAIIDWGGVRAGSVADDIGCWTAHGATDRIPLPAYTAAFLEGYRRSNDLTMAAAAAVPLFQRLRIASRACYVTDPGALAAVEAWMRRAFSQAP